MTISVLILRFLDPTGFIVIPVRSCARGVLMKPHFAAVIVAPLRWRPLFFMSYQTSDRDVEGLTGGKASTANSVWSRNNVCGYRAVGFGALRYYWKLLERSHSCEELETSSKNGPGPRQNHKARPGLLQRLSLQHTPQYLWIGCADSRVPANEIIGLLPGELLFTAIFRFSWFIRI